MDFQCIQASSSKSISLPNVRTDFHIYIARQSATLTKMFKCFAWQYEYQCLPLHIEILLQKFLFYNDCLDSCWSTVVKSEMAYLLKKVCIIIIHINSTQILDMYCCHKHQQQRYHNENTKTCMLVHYMYVYIFFPLTKVIPIMFEYVATHYLYKQG